MLVLSVVLTLAIVVYTIIIEILMFKKVGTKGWKAIIPFYRKKALFKQVWDDKKPFVVWLATTIVQWVSILIYIGSIFGTLGMAFMAYGSSSAMSGVLATTILGVVSLFLFYIAGFIVFIVNAMASFRISFCFKREIGYGIGLAICPIVFKSMIVFGKSNIYAGNAYKEPNRIFIKENPNPTAKTSPTNNAPSNNNAAGMQPNIGMSTQPNPSMPQMSNNPINNTGATANGQIPNTMTGNLNSYQQPKPQPQMPQNNQNNANASQADPAKPEPNTGNQTVAFKMNNNQ